MHLFKGYYYFSARRTWQSLVKVQSFLRDTPLEPSSSGTDRLLGAGIQLMKYLMCFLSYHILKV